MPDSPALPGDAQSAAERQAVAEIMGDTAGAVDAEVDVQVDLYDSDIPRLENVLRALSPAQGHRVNLEGFRKEVIERFGEEGFGVDVKVYEKEYLSGETVYQFNIALTSVKRSEEFDHDRMAHEVQHDILDISEPGKIVGDPHSGGIFRPL